MRRYAVAAMLLAAIFPIVGQAADRPNILWITCEDTGPHLGAYGDRYAGTPNLDRLATRGMIYANVWSNAPVCAPARTAIIAGMYPTSTGSEHMRSMTRLPAGMKMYPQYLREAGYYCTNNVKEDYNLEKPGQVWDNSSAKAHWRNRKAGQPFFAIFNFTMTHESQIRLRPHTAIQDPATVRVPAYHPDTPEVRQDWAQYYDKITEMDRRAGEILAQLREDGLEDDTVVFFYGDHGPGMPRSKRWPYDSGLHVPLIVHVPAKFRDLAPQDWRPGGQSARLVSFVDLAPTLMSLAGIQPSGRLQGHAFLGRNIAPEQPYLYGFRGRMDERYDLVRSVRDQRYVYIRNFMPHKIYGQYIDYMFQTPTTQVWRRLYDEGKLNPTQRRFWETKPPEELYDLQADPDEIRNLAGTPDQRATLERFRKALREWLLAMRDVGFLPEGEIHSRSQSSTPYEMGHNSKLYPMESILDAADLASSLQPRATAALLKAMQDEDGAVRYWGAMGILMRGGAAVEEARAALTRALGDPSPYVRIVAAETLGRYSSTIDLNKALSILMGLAPADRNGVYVSLMALNAIDSLGEKASPVRAAVAKLPQEDPAAPERMRTYIPLLIERITAGNQ